MTPNPGRCPCEAEGKRVRGRLANGQLFGAEPVSAGTPAGWPADGRFGCRWILTGHSHDIAEYEVIA